MTSPRKATALSCRKPLTKNRKDCTSRKPSAMKKKGRVLLTVPATLPRRLLVGCAILQVAPEREFRRQHPPSAKKYLRRLRQPKTVPRVPLICSAPLFLQPAKGRTTVPDVGLATRATALARLIAVRKAKVAVSTAQVRTKWRMRMPKRPPRSVTLIAIIH